VRRAGQGLLNDQRRRNLPDDDRRHGHAGVAGFLPSRPCLQVAVPGTKVIFCCGSGTLDMKHTTFAIGCLENAMVSVAATEVGHYMGVPTMNPAMSTDARYPAIRPA
jgi:hypothetical protein